MSKKPTTNEKHKFALTHTPAPQSCQIYVSRHSWTPPHNLRFKTKFSFSIIGNTFLSPRVAGVQPMRENSLLWIGSRACSHKNGIFDWVMVFVSFNTKRKKEF